MSVCNMNQEEVYVIIIIITNVLLLNNHKQKIIHEGIGFVNNFVNNNSEELFNDKQIFP